jgi:hypothetical protein
MASGIHESFAQFLIEKMQEWDPNLDISKGSQFYQQVIAPALLRLGPDPTHTDAEQVIIDRVQSHDPEITIEQGSGVRDILITPLDAVLEPLRRFARTLVLRGSWLNVDSLTEEEVDDLAARIFLTRDMGEYATGSLRLKFASPRSVTVTTTNISYAGSLRFIPSSAQSISISEMASNRAGAYYYFDVNLIAENAGDAYNVEAGSITSMDGVPGLLSVEQRFDFSKGRAKQTNAELRDAAEIAIAVRNLVTERSLRTVLPQQFPAAIVQEVVGRNSALMERDLVRGPTQVAGIPQGIIGPEAPDLVLSDKLHIGGFTDIWIRPSASSSSIQETVDVENLTDEGVLVFHSMTGAVNGGTPEVLNDVRGFFTEEDGGFLPVQAGDFAIVEGLLTSGHHTEFTVDSGGVADKSLTMSSNISITSLSNRSYEIRRRIDGWIHISLDTLVAEQDGSALSDGNGDPYLPVPGKLLSSEGIVSDQNIGLNNVSLPLFYIEQIEILDAITKQPTGELVPEADPVVHYLMDRVSSSKVWIRTIYRLPTRYSPGAGTKFYTLDATTYYEGAEQTGTGTVSGVDTVSTTVDYATAYASEYASRQIQVGDLLIFNDGGTLYSHHITEVNVGGDPLEYRVDGSLPVPTTGGTVTFVQATTAALMTLQNDMDLYYFDFIAERVTGSRQEIGTTVSTPTGGVIAQGWRVIPRLEGYSFSTLEEPILQISELVNDTVDLTTGARHIRLTYRTTPLVAEIQAFLDEDEERVPSAHLLARRTIPARVHIAMHYTPGTVTNQPAVSVARTALEEFIEEGSHALNATNLSNVLEDLGASKVVYPFSVVVEYAGKSRSGKYGYGKFMSFHGYDGAVLPLAVDSIVGWYSVADYTPGSVEPINS